MRSALRRRGVFPFAIAACLIVAIVVAIFLRADAPPEAARLLPESDAILFLQLKTLRSATHFDQTPVTHSPEFQQFIASTGIVPERDLDAVAFAVHHMPDPHGPNGPVAYSEVFVGHFDGVRLATYLHSIASGEETYAGHTVYCIPIEGRTLRIAQIGYDTIAASNMPTPEQMHSMLDRSRASALSTSGSSLLAARFHQVPLLSQAWGIGRVGLPFAHDGRIQFFGLELPMAEDTDLVASLRYTGSVRLRVEEFAPSANDAHATTESMSTLLDLTRGMTSAGPSQDPAAAAIRQVLDSAKIEQHDDRVLLTADASIDQIKALASAHNPATTAADSLTDPASPAPQSASKH